MKKDTTHRVDTISLGDLNPLNKGGLKAQDVLVGSLLLGLGGGALVRKGLLTIDATMKKSNPAGGLPKFVLDNAFAVGALLASVGGYVLGEKVAKKAPLIGGSHTTGVYIGGLAVGLALLARAQLAQRSAAFADVSVVNLGYGGVLTNDGGGLGYGGFGLLTGDNGAMGSLEGLAAVSMGDDYDGIEALASMP